MKLVIAEKPSVAQSLAAVIGATARKDGYLEGGGWRVSWCVGHLAGLADADAYNPDYAKWRYDDLPILPEPWQMVVSKDKKKQFDVLKQLMNAPDVTEVVNACDAGREGELIFRSVYELAGCQKPMKRLWISSMEDSAIREGFANLRPGADYDGLRDAALCRAKADWLVGINATRLFSVLYHRTLNIGRVMSPTLALIVQREAEIDTFKPVPFYTVTLELPGFTVSGERMADKAAAQQLKTACQGAAATVKKVGRKNKSEKPPALYDLTTLQRDANRLLGYTAQQTLDYLQNLYEKKLCTYPRTDSRYLTSDMAEGLPVLVNLVANAMPFRKGIAISCDEALVINDKKVTDHHALLVTPNRPLALYKNEKIIYDMIARRMVEAFSPECVKDTTSVEAECCGVAFEAKGCIVRKEGWRSVYGEDKEDTILPDWKEGDTLAMAGCSMSSGMTRPKPLHTESSLLAAMETAGREGVEDEEARQALKDCGIGTPATRAAIIETLLRREYMTRVKKSLVPTEKGLALYSIVKEMDIADVEMTGQWEAELAKIEKGKTAHEAFMRDIEAYTRKITTELLASDKIFGHKASGCACPKCGKGTMQFYGKVVRCDNPECALPVFRQIAGKTLTDGEMTDLLTEGKTGVLGGFKSRQGKPFSAAVAFDADFNTNFIFPEAKGARKGTNMKGKRK